MKSMVQLLTEAAGSGDSVAFVKDQPGEDHESIDAYMRELLATSSKSVEW